VNRGSFGKKKVAFILLTRTLNMQAADHYQTGTNNHRQTQHEGCIIIKTCVFRLEEHVARKGVMRIYTGWRRETVKFEIIRKKTKETYKTLFDPENVFSKSGNFIRHHFLKITSLKCCPFRS
jgi:5-methylcytosine-specific restriction endonuclease McrA